MYKATRNFRAKCTTGGGGFTLAELLIVVAVIAVLVAVAIPTFGSQLEKARQSTDTANLRDAYASAKLLVLNQADDDTNVLAEARDHKDTNGDAAPIAYPEYWVDPDTGKFTLAEDPDVTDPPAPVTAALAFGKATTGSTVNDIKGLPATIKYPVSLTNNLLTGTVGKGILVSFKYNSTANAYELTEAKFAKYPSSVVLLNASASKQQDTVSIYPDDVKAVAPGSGNVYASVDLADLLPTFYTADDEGALTAATGTKTYAIAKDATDTTKDAVRKSDGSLVENVVSFNGATKTQLDFSYEDAPTTDETYTIKVTVTDSTKTANVIVQVTIKKP